MAIAPFGIIDLSFVTATLVKSVEDCRDAWPVWGGANPPYTITVSGQAPDTVRSGSDCELSIYLFHITQDKYQLNAPVVGPRARQIPLQPLSLDLFYLVSAYADDDFVHEQQAMSIALRCFHEMPILRMTVPFPGGAPVQEECTVTMEVETSDEIARLWQATTVAHRLSTVYRAGVVFMPPEAPTQPTAPPPTRVSLGGDVAELPLASLGAVAGSRRTLIYPTPVGTPAVSTTVTVDLSPATVAAGQRLVVEGAGFDQPTAARVYLVDGAGGEQEVTTWKVPDPAAPLPPVQTATRLTLELPAAGGAAPGGTPAPGIYQFRVGSDLAQGDAQTYRSNGTPFSLAARVKVPAGPPLLPPAAGLFTMTGVGFGGGGPATEVLLGTTALTRVNAAPAAGEFRVTPAGTTISFRVPAALPTGRYGVRVRVNQVESDPSWWIDVP